jgi:hypothetical protein
VSQDPDERSSNLTVHAHWRRQIFVVVALSRLSRYQLAVLFETGDGDVNQSYRGIVVKLYDIGRQIHQHGAAIAQEKDVLQAIEIESDCSQQR